ncbi:MAG: hypothetical protein ACK4WH_12665 [Phycisphaerales bacterium]
MARWLGPLVGLAAVALFFATRERVVGFDTKPLSVVANAGRLTVACNARMTGQNGWICQDFHADPGWWFSGWFDARPSPAAAVMVPLWVIALAGAGAGVWGWRARPGPAGATLCGGCGYDLSGLGGAERCPECGHVRRSGR